MKRLVLAGLIFALGAAAPAPAPVPASTSATASSQDQYVLDPHAGSWLRGPDLPAPRQDAATAVLGGRIYVIGGFGESAAPTNTNFVLEPAAGTNLAPTLDQAPLPVLPLGAWTAARPVPEPLDHAAAASLDGFIYVAGGSVEKLVSNKFWRYDPIGDSWTALTPLPVPRYGATMQAFGGKLYLIGGATSHGHDERGIEVYDPAASSWSVIQEALAVEREASQTAIFQGRIALVGGRDRQERNETSCDLYDPLRQKWFPCSSMHAGRSQFGLASVGDRLIAIGGNDLLTGLTTQTTEISGAGVFGWMDGPWLPAPRQGMSVAVLGHTIWVIGGSHWEATSPTASVMRYVVPVIKVKFGGRAPQ